MSTRTITDHKVNGLNEHIDINVLDEPGQGGACHHYEIVQGLKTWHIDFQEGPLKEAGPNGISIEALLAICQDRLRGFQSGQFSTRENSVALTKIDEAMMWLHKRTRDRVARGVEGTNQK